MTFEPDRPAEARDGEATDSAEDATATPAARTRRFATDALDRYLPVVAIIGMVATYLQVRPDIALVLIGGVWLVATRITRNHRFLGLSLTEGLAWAATILITLILLFSLLGAASPPA